LSPDGARGTSHGDAFRSEVPVSGSCDWFPLGPDEIRAWVERHRDELPDTLGGLARYPIPFRKAIVHAVAPEVRVALWREHLTGFLAPDRELDDAQRALVRDALDALPAIVGVAPPEGQPRARALEERMRALLTGEQARRMFGTLGPPEPPGGLPIPPDALPPEAGPA
jgi:hypothetical protein